MSDVQFTAKIKAFSSETSVRDHKILVEDDGTVRVYDDVAGHYTACHSMSPRTVLRMQVRAEELRSAPETATCDRCGDEVTETIAVPVPGSKEPTQEFEYVCDHCYESADRR